MTPLRVAIEISIGDERVWRLSSAIDPSAIRLERSVPFDPGERVRLDFELPGGAVVRTGGRLTGPNEIALDLEPPERQAVLAYLREER